MKRLRGKHNRPGEVKARILDHVIRGRKGRRDLKTELRSSVSNKDVDYHLAGKGGLTTDGILVERKGFLDLKLTDFSSVAKAMNYLVLIPAY